MVDTPSKWLVSYRHNPNARMRLFCFPYAGASGAVYRKWNDAFPDVEVCLVEPPGRWARVGEPPFRRMAPLVDAIVRELGELLEAPFALFGHSLGGLTAFEVARSLRRMGHCGPRMLLVSARGAPQLAAETLHAQIHALPESEFCRQITCLYGPTAGPLLKNADLRELVLPVMRADFTVLETYEYVPEAPLDCPIMAFGGDSDPNTPPSSLLGWHEHTTAEFQSRIFPGDHFYINTAEVEFRDVVSSALSAVLPHGRVHTAPANPDSSTSTACPASSR